jgi:hypothetical protein
MQSQFRRASIRRFSGGAHVRQWRRAEERFMSRLYATKLIGFLGGLLAGLVLASPAANAAVTYTLVTQEYNPGFMTGNVGPATAIVRTDGFVTGSFMVAAPFPPGDSCVAVDNPCQSITLVPDLSGGDFVLLAALPNGFFGNGFGFPLGSLAAPGVYASTAGRTASLTVSVPEPSTWAMMLLGFAGLGLACLRRNATTAKGATGLGGIFPPQLVSRLDA